MSTAVDAGAVRRAAGMLFVLAEDLADIGAGDEPNAVAARDVAAMLLELADELELEHDDDDDHDREKVS